MESNLDNECNGRGDGSLKINLLQVTEGILKSDWNCSIKESQKQKVGCLIEGKIKEGTQILLTTMSAL